MDCPYNLASRVGTGIVAVLKTLVGAAGCDWSSNVLHAVVVIVTRDTSHANQIQAIVFGGTKR